MSDDQRDINDLLSDDDDDESKNTAEELKKTGNVQKLLMAIPPDFELAERNGVRG
jgi:hypothetical protein